MRPASTNPSGGSRLSKHQTRANLTWFNWNMGLRSVFDTFCGGTTFIFVAFALALGVPSEAMGYVTALTAAACALELAGLAMMDRVEDKKRSVLVIAVMEPVVFVAAVLAVPYLPAVWRLPALGLAVLAAAGCLHMTRPFTDEWLASSVPGGLRGRYLGRRVQLQSVALLVSMLVAGYAGKWADGRIVPLSLVLAAAGGFGIAAVASLGRTTLPAASAAHAFAWSDLLTVWRDRGFVRYLAVSVIYNLPFYFAGSYYQVFNLKVLELSTTTIAYISAGYLLVKIPLSRPIGGLIDRWGERRSLILAAAIYPIAFICLPLTATGHRWLIAVTWVLFGVGDVTWSVTMTRVLYGVVPAGRSRATYFAVTQLMAFGESMVCAATAVYALSLLRNTQWQWGPVSLGQYHVYYLLVTLGVILVTPVVLVIPMPRR